MPEFLDTRLGARWAVRPCPDADRVVIEIAEHRDAATMISWALPPEEAFALAHDLMRSISPMMMQVRG